GVDRAAVAVLALWHGHVSPRALRPGHCLRAPALCWHRAGGLPDCALGRLSLALLGRTDLHELPVGRPAARSDRDGRLRRAVALAAALDAAGTAAGRPAAHVVAAVPADFPFRRGEARER